MLCDLNRSLPLALLGLLLIHRGNLEPTTLIGTVHKNVTYSFTYHNLSKLDRATVNLYRNHTKIVGCDPTKTLCVEKNVIINISFPNITFHLMNLSLSDTSIYQAKLIETSDREPIKNIIEFFLRVQEDNTTVFPSASSITTATPTVEPKTTDRYIFTALSMLSIMLLAGLTVFIIFLLKGSSGNKQPTSAPLAPSISLQVASKAAGSVHSVEYGELDFQSWPRSKGGGRTAEMVFRQTDAVEYATISYPKGQKKR